MKAVVLGAAAGGGFPQWNSNAEACRRARAGEPGVAPRTQASLAVSGDGERWFLINASPDLRQQIEAREILHPRRGPAILADRRRHPHRRGCRCDRRAVASARTPGFHDLRQPARARRARGQSDLRRAGRGLRAPPGGAAWPAIRASPCRWQHERPFSRIVRCPGQGRALARDGPIRPTSLQASRATRSASRCAQASAGCSTSPAARK